jgi:hypothetical protein
VIRRQPPCGVRRQRCGSCACRGPWGWRGATAVVPLRLPPEPGGAAARVAAWQLLNTEGGHLTRRRPTVAHRASSRPVVDRSPRAGGGLVVTHCGVGPVVTLHGLGMTPPVPSSAPCRCRAGRRVGASQGGSLRALAHWLEGWAWRPAQGPAGHGYGSRRAGAGPASLAAVTGSTGPSLLGTFHGVAVVHSG